MGKGAKSNYYRKRRNKLMAEDPHCEWCGVEVVYYQLGYGERMPDNFATIDHLYSRNSPDRQLMAMDGKTKTLVLACNKCNKKRDTEETAALGIEELRARAGKPDRNWATHQAQRLRNIK